MNKFIIKYSKPARNDILRLHKFVYQNSQSLETTDKTIERIVIAIAKLDFMPERYSKYRYNSGNRQLRVYPIKNYVIFYRVNNDEKSVEIVRIFYKSEDYTELI